MEIRYVKNGLANRFKNHIELNENLKKYPELHDSILRHELEHTDKYWSIKDLKLDLIDNQNINSFDKIKFMIKYPRSLRQLLPIYFDKEKGIVYDLNLIVMYLIYTTLFLLIYFIGGKIK